MTSKHITVPEPGVREIAHQLAYKLAVEQMAAITDIQEQCRRSDCQYLPDPQAVAIKHLNQAYHIGYPTGEVTFADADEAVPLRDKILTLHYLTRAKGTPLTGKMITYKELHDGLNYYPTFFKRAISPVVNRYKDEPQKLIEAGQRLGGYKAEYGDTAVTIPAFTRVPLTFVLWRGDKEFAPDGNIMFDSTISDYLPTEDISILCEVIAWRLVRL